MPLRGEGAHHAYAGEVFFHDAGQHTHAFLELTPQRPHPQPEHGAAPHRERHEAHAQQTQHQILPHVNISAEADQHRELEQAHDAGFDKTPHALDVEHAAGDQVAGMDAIVITERQPLQLFKKGQPQLVTETLADGFRQIVVDQGEETA